MNKRSPLIICNKSIHLKRVTKAIAKNQGVTLSRAFIKFADEELKKFDISEYKNPNVPTKTAEFKIVNFPDRIRTKIKEVAETYDVSPSMLSKFLLILFTNGQSKDMKIYFSDGDSD